MQFLNIAICFGEKQDEFVFLILAYFALHKFPLLYMPKINLLRTKLLCWGECPFPIAKIIPWNKSNQGDKRLSQ